MARNRMIKPDFWTSKTLMRVSRDSRLMFIGLWNFADDYGILENSNRRILGDLFPYDEQVSDKDIQKWKDELVKEGLLLKIEWQNHHFLFIRSWEEHQKVAHRSRETIPVGVIQETLTRYSRESHAVLSGKVEVEVEVENTTNVVSAPLENFGNKEVNEMLLALKGKVGISSFVDSAIERNMAKHCVNLLEKIGKDEFVRRLDVLLKDSFHQKNCNKIKYIYNNVKGFIDSKPKSRLVIIS